MTHILLCHPSQCVVPSDNREYIFPPSFSESHRNSLLIKHFLMQTEIGSRKIFFCQVFWSNRDPVTGRKKARCPSSCHPACWSLVIGHLHVPPFLTNHLLVAFILTLVHCIAHCVNMIPVLGSFVVFLQISSTSFHMPVASSCWNFFAKSPLTSPSSSCRIDCASFTAPCVLQYCLCRLLSDKLQTSQDLSCLKPSLVSLPFAFTLSGVLIQSSINLSGMAGRRLICICRPSQTLFGFKICRPSLQPPSHHLILHCIILIIIDTIIGARPSLSRRWSSDLVFVGWVEPPHLFRFVCPVSFPIARPAKSQLSRQERVNSSSLFLQLSPYLCYATCHPLRMLSSVLVSAK